VHADVFPEIGIRSLQRQQHADARIVMHIRAARTFDSHNSSQAEHFPNLVDEVVVKRLERYAGLSGEGLGEQFFRRFCTGTRRELFGKSIDKSDELFGVGNRCAFAEEFDHCRYIFLGTNEQSNSSRLGLPVGSSCHRFCSRLAEDFDCLFFVSFCLNESLFAVHHRQACLVSKRFYYCSGYFHYVQ
jgi:hypothetical protein